MLDHKRALLLNAGYEPLRVVSWKRAFTLLFQDKVEVLEQYEDFVRSVSEAFRLPAVIKLRGWVHLKRRMPVIRFSRSNLYLRDDFTCQYCLVKYPEKQLTLDHVIPVSRGGRKSWENIVTACLTCNQRKGHKPPESVGMKLNRPPSAPNWLPGNLGGITTNAPPPLWAPYLTPHSTKVAA